MSTIREKADYAVGLMGRPRAMIWFVLIYLAIMGFIHSPRFDNVMDRIGMTNDTMPAKLSAPQREEN